MTVRLWFLCLLAFVGGVTVSADVSASMSQRFVAAEVVTSSANQKGLFCLIGFVNTSGLTNVSWSTADGSPLAGVDYVAGSGSLDVGEFPCDGCWVHIRLIDDGIPKSPRFFYIDFYWGATAAGHYRSTITIINAKGPELPQLSMDETVVTEGPAGTKTTGRVHLH